MTECASKTFFKCRRVRPGKRPTAIGGYNQFIYVNPTRNLEIVKRSANSAYATEPDGSADQEFETLQFFRAIGSQSSPSG
jgi:hypothetical protein